MSGPQHESLQRLASPSAALLLQRWQRSRMRVRCGLADGDAAWIRLYLLIGQRVARRGLQAPMAVHFASLQTLLKSADDEALPWSWRSACLGRAGQPLAALAAIWRYQDPAALQAAQCAVRRSSDRLAAVPVAERR